jgi:hypothetical protein
VASSRSPCGPGKFALCRLSEFRNSAPVIAVILRRVRQVARVLEQSIQPSQAGHLTKSSASCVGRGPFLILRYLPRGISIMTGARFARAPRGSSLSPTRGAFGELPVHFPAIANRQLCSRDAMRTWK